MPPLATDLFDYALPDGLVAREPVSRRDQSRLLVIDRAGRSLRHFGFSDLPQFLRAGDALFRNNAMVFPARLRAVRPGGAKVECLLLERESVEGGDPGEGEVWRCLLKPGRRLPAGADFAGIAGSFGGRILSWADDGTARVRFSTAGRSLMDVAGREGEMPLPPYLGLRSASERERDRERYQTVYADPGRPVAAAAPTAGLHFTDELLAVLAGKGVRLLDLTLNVGLGTFRPITKDAIELHPIHRESYQIPAETQRALFPPGDPAAASAGRRIAVGTTVVRAIEDFLAGHDRPLGHAYAGSAGIYLYPPRLFRGLDALITNFHQPRSTLLCLVAAFLTPGATDGIAWLKEIYAEAISLRYRFFSYGDAMLIL